MSNLFSGMEQSKPAKANPVYSGVGSFTLKSIANTKEQLIKNGYSENMADIFGAKVETNEAGNKVAKFAAILYNEENDLELIHTFQITDETIHSANTGKYKFFADSMNDAWHTSVETMKEIADNHPSEGYRNITRELLNNNPRPMKKGEKDYYKFLSAIMRPQVTEAVDGQRVNVLNKFFSLLETWKMKSENLLNGEFTNLQQLPTFLNAAEYAGSPKQVDKIVLFVAVRTKNNGQQVSEVYSDYDGTFYYRMGAGGEADLSHVSKVKSQIEKDNADEYRPDINEKYTYKIELLSEMTVADLLSTPNTDSNTNEEALSDFI